MKQYILALVLAVVSASVAFAVNPIKAVSYTHLTLPTN